MPESARHHLTGTTEGYGSGRSAEARAVLIDAGNALLGGRSFGSRVVRIGAGLEIRRGGGTVADGAHWELPDRRVSSRHAAIHGASATYLIEDLGSRNGTLCDGRRLDGSQTLRDGSRLFLGSQAAVFRLVSDETLVALEEEAACPFGPVATASPRMAEALRRLRRLAIVHEDVLIAGETGVGKEVYAQAVHQTSGRPGKLVAINCAALPAALVESELFGYVRGAHSLAVGNKPGLIEQADRGTLFLDEVGDMPSPLQAKLLRFLQTREYLPLGATTARKIDVRVVAATSHADKSSTAPGLRGDLAGRLGAEPIVLPPLRERPEDVGSLVAHFLSNGGGAPPQLAPEAFFALLLHDWPRNVRELEKVAREALAMARGADVIRLEHLPPGFGARVESPPAAGSEPDAHPPDVGGGARRRSPRAIPTKQELEALLTAHAGNVASVARDLQRQPAVVWRAIDRYAIDPQRFRPSGDGS